MLGRKARRAALAAKVEFVRNEPDIAAMMGRARVWLGAQPGFEQTTRTLRETIITDLLARELCKFEVYDDSGALGIRLVDPSGRPLPLATLWSARIRAKLKGI